MKPTVRRINFGVEFALLIVLPAVVLIAGAITASLAFRSGFTPLQEPTGFVVQAH